MAPKVILFGPLIAALNTVYDRERRQIFGSHGLGFCQIRQRMSRTVAGHAGKPFSIADQTRAPPQRSGPPRQRGVGRDHTIILAARRPQRGRGSTTAAGGVLVLEGQAGAASSE
ncbi:hypothetical protein BN1723_009048 [Verticillium longisporum]|uniref:Uncharacterized protein n=1 Tax=Verticillium longisporum TaxID=100787 RepID=A0A0G4MCC1_VERLO|nr:hypothetical protein HYQ44_007693 [Verticillium longisporum]KAG7148298.1 hypothetical protein HYQ46_002830 [Verticillium longisporum]CRK09342.1 hypothetical protein BN1723_009048 [Verticillium longisporum]CRK31761.1 hypothetical protein BN1708_005562 [Verticillium longisporum]